MDVSLLTGAIFALFLGMLLLLVFSPPDRCFWHGYAFSLMFLLMFLCVGWLIIACSQPLEIEGYEKLEISEVRYSDGVVAQVFYSNRTQHNVNHMFQCVAQKGDYVKKTTLNDTYCSIKFSEMNKEKFNLVSLGN